MNIGHRIENGIRRGESCCLCREPIKTGQTCYALTCGHIIHSRCKKYRVSTHLEKVNKAKEDGRTGNDLPQFEIVCPLYHQRRVLFDAVTIPPPPPPPSPEPAAPHFGYQDRQLCNFCHDGRRSFEKMMHTCGLLFCRGCFENENRILESCSNCSGSLFNTQLLVIDPRELEDNLE